SVLYSMPGWLDKKLIDQFGEESAVAIMQSLFVRNKASIRVTKLDKLSEIKATTGAEQSILSPVGLVKTSGHFAGTDYFANGDITIQDESSQL
ncbi:16S rRNA (cytosine(967)-C(5))-methyltransferase RsmB, partial [Pediococcus acidilactici]